jgi:hypothetical protein
VVPNLGRRKEAGKIDENETNLCHLLCLSCIHIGRPSLALNSSVEDSSSSLKLNSNKQKEEHQREIHQRRTEKGIGGGDREKMETIFLPRSRATIGHENVRQM